MLNGRAALIPLLSAALLVVGVSSCKKNHPPDVPAVPTGPDFCFKDTTYTFSTIVTDPDGDSVSVRFVWGDSTISDWRGWHASGDTVTASHAWLSSGTFEVRAWAEDRLYHESGLSAPLTMQVALRRPPETPDTPTGPDIGGRDSSYTFAAVAFHPDSITVAIRFAWGSGDTSDWSPFVASGESERMSHAWSTTGNHTVTAQAKDTGNAMSLWSSPHAILIRPPDTLRIWRFQLKVDSEEISLYSSPAIGPDGTIYVGSSDSALYALNPDGTLKWRYLTGSNVRSSPAVAPDGTVYVGSYDSHLYAINPDGTLRWNYQTNGSVRTSPAIAVDGTIYVAPSGDRLYAVNPDGTLKWSTYVENVTYSSPAIGSDGTIYVGSTSGYLYAVNPDSTLKWSYRSATKKSIRSSPALAADGTIYFGCDNWNVYALNSDSTLRWQYLTGHYVRSSCAIGTDGIIYLGSGDGCLYALNPDGTLKWLYSTSGNVEGAPAIAADGTIYFGSGDHCLYAVYPDGTLKWRYNTDGYIRTSPNIGPDGTVYFTSNDGFLYALKGTSPLADSPWPKFHHDLRNTGRVGGGR